MPLLQLDDQSYLCDQCGKVYERPDVECCVLDKPGHPEMLKRYKPRILRRWVDPATGHTMIREDVGFGQTDVDVEADIEYTNRTMLESLEAGQLKHVLGMRIRLRDLADQAPGKYRFLVDGRAWPVDQPDPTNLAPRDTPPASGQTSPGSGRTPPRPELSGGPHHGASDKVQAVRKGDPQRGEQEILLRGVSAEGTGGAVEGGEPADSSRGVGSAIDDRRNDTPDGSGDGLDEERQERVPGSQRLGMRPGGGRRERGHEDRGDDRAPEHGGDTTVPEAQIKEREIRRTGSSHQGRGHNVHTEDRVGMRQATPEEAQRFMRKKTRSRGTLKKCLCGCGGDTYANFVPGHDSKVKVMCVKVDNGEMKVEELPPKIQEYYAARKGDPSLLLSEWFGRG